jgi:hypothetical protein
MVDLVVTANFENALQEIYSNNLLDKIQKALEQIQIIPDISAANVPNSILKKWGDGVRILPVNPFDIVYTYNCQDELISYCPRSYSST